jgi:hypothetical protein
MAMCRDEGKWNLHCGDGLQNKNTKMVKAKVPAKWLFIAANLFVRSLGSHVSLTSP